MKILLLGANGQLGQTFARHGGLASRGDLVIASRDGRSETGIPAVTADLGDNASLEAMLDTVRPDLIINAAAYTAVDKAESDEVTASQVNGVAPGVLGRWAARHDALLVHYSTDYVFPGDATKPYLADDPTGPQGVYGHSKLVGEQAVRNSGARHLILRTAWVYSSIGHNFLKTMLRLGAERDELRVVADQHGTPTTTTLIVEATLAAIDRYQAAPDAASPLGTFHLTASGSTTWHGFAEAIFDQAHAEGLIERRPKVVAIGTDQFPTPARRPAYSVLDNEAFAQAFHHPLPDWRQGLRDTILALRAR